MKKNILTTIILLISFNGFTQVNHYFKKSYGLPPNMVEVASSIIPIADGYIFTGGRFDALNQHDAPVIFKISLDGDSIWEYTYFDSTYIYYWLDLIRVNEKVFATGVHYEPAIDKWSAYFAKLDTSGSLISQYILSDSIYNSFSFEMTQSLDGNFLLIGHKENVANFTDGLIIKVDTAGNKLWEKLYPGGNYYDTFSWIEPLSDSSYIACGGYNWASAGEGWILKLDTACNVQWQRLRSYSPTGRTVYTCVKPAIDGGFILTGTYNLLNGTAIVTKTDNQGFEQWTKYFYPEGFISPSQTLIYEIIPLYDSSYIICGKMPDSVSSYINNQGFISKLDINGNEKWRRKYFVYPYNDTEFYDIDTTADGGFILVGRGESINDVNAYVVKTNCLGFADPPLASFTYSHQGNTATFYNLSQFADSCTYYFGDGNSQTVLLTDTTPVTHTYATASTYPVTLIVRACGDSAVYTFNVITAIDDAQLAQKTLLVYPNPASTYFTVKCRLSNNAQIVITDIAGRKLHTQNVTQTTAETKINLQHFNAGIYFVSIISNGNNIGIKRFVKE
ncbi:MAG TPA: T9SS type A sorting domain-containing protein [Bacteroidia bacterium]|nr:T9SS type A sorting domain-containing protein [Bacteroidia bacterium]HNU32955.1 T9SS type A sorting domain-containing protein [Bacteroidia bacterium]